MVKVGTSHIAKITTQSDLDDFVSSLNIKGETVVIKPNWVDGLNCSHTEVKALELLLSSLKERGKKVVFVESYTFWRTDKMCVQGRKEDYFSSTEASLEEGKKHWDFFKRMDEWFLEREGFTKLFNKFGAEYLNITNEVWSGNVASHDEVKSLIKGAYYPLYFVELLSYVPKRLFDLRSSSFISFAKAKLDTYYGLSLSIKNMFGLIPDPCRAIKYHKGEDKHLNNAIIDINKVYQSLFDLKFVVDGIFTACSMDFDSNTTIPYEDWGLVVGGNDGLEVDVIAGRLMKGEPQHAMRGLPAMYQQTFGGNLRVDTDILSKNWFLER